MFGRLSNDSVVECQNRSETPLGPSTRAVPQNSGLVLPPSTIYVVSVPHAVQ